MFGIVDKILAGTSAGLLAALIALWSYMHLWALPAEYRAGHAEGARAERAQAAADLEEKNAMIRRVSESATDAWNERDAANRAAATASDKAAKDATAWPEASVTPAAAKASCPQPPSVPQAAIDQLNRIK